MAKNKKRVNSKNVKLAQKSKETHIVIDSVDSIATIEVSPDNESTDIVVDEVITIEPDNIPARDIFDANEEKYPKSKSKHKKKKRNNERIKTKEDLNDTILIEKVDDETTVNSQDDIKASKNENEFEALNTTHSEAMLNHEIPTTDTTESKSTVIEDESSDVIVSNEEKLSNDITEEETFKNGNSEGDISIEELKDEDSITQAILDDITTNEQISEDDNTVEIDTTVNSEQSDDVIVENQDIDDSEIEQTDLTGNNIESVGSKIQQIAVNNTVENAQESVNTSNKLKLNALLLVLIIGIIGVFVINAQPKQSEFSRGVIEYSSTINDLEVIKANLQSLSEDFNQVDYDVVNEFSYFVKESSIPGYYMFFQFGQSFSFHVRNDSDLFTSDKVDEVESLTIQSNNVYYKSFSIKDDEIVSIEILIDPVSLDVVKYSFSDNVNDSLENIMHDKDILNKVQFTISYYMELMAQLQL